jgi:phosphatidylglycerophosphate synthase
VSAEAQKADYKKVPPVSVLKKNVQQFYKDPNGPLSESFNRVTYHKVTIYLSWLFLHTKIRPNQVTLISLITGVAGCIFFAFPGLYPIIGIVLLNLSLIFDIVDGDIARYRKICSLSGAFFDRLVTAIVDPLVFIGLGFAVYFRLGSPVALGFGVFATFLLLLFKIINGYLHIAVLEPIMHKKHTEMLKNLCKTVPKEEAVFSTFFEYQSKSTILKIAEFVIGEGLIIIAYFAILLDCIFNWSFTLLSFTFNLTYLYLIGTAFALFAACAWSTYYIVKTRMPEQLYFRYFGKETN